MTNTGCASATSGRNMTSRSHSSAPTVRSSWRKLCWLRIMRSEFRATESMGFTRPPSRTGRRPKASTSKPRTAPGGSAPRATPTTASAPAGHGAYRRILAFMSGLHCCGTGRLDRSLLAPQPAAERDREVHEQPERHEGARDVREEPARVRHHLEDGERVALPEARLVEGLAVVAQRLVHVDEHVPLLAAPRVREVHEAREVLRDVGARVDVVAELLERHRVGQVLAPRPHLEHVGAP